MRRATGSGDKPADDASVNRCVLVIHSMLGHPCAYSVLLKFCRVLVLIQFDINHKEDLSYIAPESQTSCGTGTTNTQSLQNAKPILVRSPSEVYYPAFYSRPPPRSCLQPVQRKRVILPRLHPTTVIPRNHTPKTARARESM